MPGFLQLQFFLKWPKTLYSLLPVPEYTSPMLTNSSPPFSRAPHTLHGTCLRFYILWDTFPGDPNKKSVSTFLNLIILQLLAYSFHSMYRTFHSWLSVCCTHSLQTWWGKGPHLFHPLLYIPGYSWKTVRETHTCVLLWDGSKLFSFTSLSIFLLYKIRVDWVNTSLTHGLSPLLGFIGSVRQLSRLIIIPRHEMPKKWLET